MFIQNSFTWRLCCIMVVYMVATAWDIPKPLTVDNGIVSINAKYLTYRNLLWIWNQLTETFQFSFVVEFLIWANKMKRTLNNNQCVTRGNESNFPCTNLCFFTLTKKVFLFYRSLWCFFISRDSECSPNDKKNIGAHRNK